MTKNPRKPGPRTPGQRPEGVQPPAHLSKNPPIPKPDPKEAADEIEAKTGPTRYGDWEHKGMAVDF